MHFKILKPGKCINSFTSLVLKHYREALHPSPVIESILDQNDQILATVGGTLFWWAKAFFVHEWVDFLSRQPRNCAIRSRAITLTPPKHPLPPPTTLSRQILVTGGQPKNGQISVTGGVYYWEGGYTLTFLDLYFIIPARTRPHPLAPIPVHPS